MQKNILSRNPHFQFVVRLKNQHNPAKYRLKIQFSYQAIFFLKYLAFQKIFII